MSDYAAIIEGQCPNGHGALERREDHGWCDQCGMGWSMRGDTITAHFAVAATTIVSGSLTMRSLGGNAEFTFRPGIEPEPWPDAGDRDG